MLIPKSHKVRHQVLKFLSDKRKNTDMKTFDSVNSAFTTSEIATGLRLDRGLVDEQLDVLYHNKEVDVIHKGKEENKFFINEKGFATVSSQAILNDGKVINSQLYNNYASTIFQVLTGVTALATIVINFASVTDLKEENKQIRLQIEEINKGLIKLTKVNTEKIDTASIKK
jgi:hypothetical protein